MLKEMKICPICKKHYSGVGAISRKDNKTKICSNCGTMEAVNEFLQHGVVTDYKLPDEVE